MLHSQLLDHLLPHLTPAAAVFSLMSLSESHNPIAALQMQDDTDLLAASHHFVSGVAGDSIK